MSIGQVLETPSMRQMIREREEAVAELERGGRAGVSVVIACFNQAEYVCEALDSVLLQTTPALEVIVIDDGSTEQADFIREQTLGRNGEDIARGTELRYVRVTNRGLPNARNVGLMLARGEWFLPLDADDWLASDYIEKTLDRAQDTGADVVLTGIQEHGPDRNGCYMAGFDRGWDAVTVDLLLSDFNRFFYCSLFRTRLLREVGGYNGRLVHGFEDWDLWIDLMKRGTQFCAVNEYLFQYRTRPGSMLSTAMAQREEIVAEIHRHHA